MEPAAILNPIMWCLQRLPAFSASAQTWSPQAWAGIAAATIIGSLWQGAVVACGLAICLRLAPSIPARSRYGIWAGGFAALVCLPFLPALIRSLTSFSFIAAPVNSFGLAAETNLHHLPAHPFLALDARWSLAIAALWLSASLLRAFGLAVHAARMRRLWNSASPVLASSLDTSFQSVAARRAAPAELCVTSDLDRPCVIGFFHPRILIPAWLLVRLTPAELEQVVLHESEHLRRMDDWTNLLQKLCLVVFPLNPALWWLERRLCAEREMACDDAVVGRTQAPRAYAACLAGLAERGLEHREALRFRDAPSLGAWQRRPELATRVHRLLRRPTVLSPATSSAAVALFGCGLVAGTVALAHSPQLVAFVAPAQQAPNSLNASARNVQPGRQGDANAEFIQSPIAFAESGGQSYRAWKTLAILPAASTGSLARTSNAASRASALTAAESARQTSESSNSYHSLAALVPEAIAARIKSQQAPQSQAEQASQSAETPATQTSWLVLTAFEEVQTSSSDDGVQGDAVVGESAPTTAATGAKTSTSLSVTRLVLRFVQPASNKPATSNAQPGSSSQPASTVPPNSNSVQPIVIPYRDGWFVIQL
jgi:beta-lactamase regulating signal transducer with metallopeptidase domain